MAKEVEEKKKVAAKKTTTAKKTTSAKKAPAKKAATKKTTAKKTTAKTTKKATTAKKTAAKKVTKKTVAKKPVAKAPTDEELIEDLRERTPDVDWEDADRKIDEAFETIKKQDEDRNNEAIKKARGLADEDKVTEALDRIKKMQEKIREEGLVTKILNGEISMKKLREEYPDIAYSEIDQVARDMFDNDELEITDLRHVHSFKDDFEYQKVLEAKEARAEEKITEEISTPEVKEDVEVKEEVKEAETTEEVVTEPEEIKPDIEMVPDERTQMENYGVEEPAAQPEKVEEVAEVKEEIKPDIEMIGDDRTQMENYGEEKTEDSNPLEMPLEGITIIMTLRDKDAKVRTLQGEVDRTNKEMVAAASLLVDYQLKLDAQKANESKNNNEKADYELI